MELSVEEINSKYDLKFDENYKELFDIIIQIFNNKMNLENYDLSNSKILNILALYYEFKEENYTQAIKYYQMALELGNTDAMCNLACYYDKEKDYDQAIKYYQMAIKLGNSTAMNNLAMHYYEKEKDYDQAIEYYQMAADLGNSDAMYDLACYYERKKKDYVQAINYYRMASELGNSNAMNNLACYYEKKEKDHVQAIKYYQMASELRDSTAINKLIKLSNIKPLKVYISINSTSTVLNNSLSDLKNKLEKKKEVIIYNNKKRIFSKLNYIDTCPICLNEKLNIILDCGHPICIDCYPSIDSCYFKCCE